MTPRTADDRRAALLRGARAEGHVAQLLEADGWVVLERNWTGGGGELDLVVRRGDQLRFVEVKARDVEDPTGLESIGAAKQRRLVGAAEAWQLGQAAPDGELCFLVALVTLDGADTYVEWFDDAFDGA